MPRPINLGNGQLLVCLDNHAQVRDVYFPYVGLENHSGGHFLHKLGLWVDNNFSWLDDGNWDISVNLLPETMVSDVTARHKFLQIELAFTDTVYNEKNIFVRKVIVKNRADTSRQIKFYFHQQLEIYQSYRGDTAYYDPINRVVVHYKGRRVFLVNALRGREPFSQFSVGLFNIEGREGTYKDAEDGHLSGNAIEHGLVDSVVGLAIDLEPHQSDNLYYWLAAGKTIREVIALNQYILQRSPPYLIKSTRDYWKAWINRERYDFSSLSPQIADLFQKSLFNLKAHADIRGGIIASCDSDLLKYGRDGYSYVWPRDAAFCVLALDAAGDVTAARRFFQFANDIITDDGYFMHKYRPDQSLGASWHPWVRDSSIQLPIQEDETAEVLFALWKHYEITHDLELVESLYNSLIKRAADFLVSYRNPATGLPNQSYDLWEERYGVFTFTSCAVYGALTAGAKFAALLGKTEAERRYLDAASELKKAILRYLYNDETQLFYKRVYFDFDRLAADSTVDMSSVYGIFKFGVLEPDDQRLKSAIERTVEHLSVTTPIGGMARYEGDMYFHAAANVPGNPWVITSLWLAQYHILQAKSEADLRLGRDWLDWAVKNASASGTLSEQLHPHTGAQLSATPLAWSHAEFVTTVVQYLKKKESL